MLIESVAAAPPHMLDSSAPALRPAAPALRCRNLTLGYERHPAVHHLTADVPAGALVAVVGPNGAGKTTLVKAIAGLLKPIEGQLERPLGSGRLAYLPQLAEMDRSFPIAVRDMVAMGLWHEVGALGRFSAAHRHQVEQALAAVGLSGFGGRTIGTLSGGQFQRALFARLLLQDAQLILLDEPFASIDSRTAHDLLALVRQWHGQRRTVIAVLHDVDQVRQHFPQTLLLARELVAFGDTPQVLTADNLLRARRMTEAFDDAAPHCDGLAGGPAEAESFGARGATHLAHPHAHTSSGHQTSGCAVGPVDGPIDDHAGHHHGNHGRGA